MSLTSCYGLTFILLAIRGLVFSCASHDFYRKSEYVLYYGIRYSQVRKMCVSYCLARWRYDVGVLQVREEEHGVVSRLVGT
jgi:hypothetical protein